MRLNKVAGFYLLAVAFLLIAPHSQAADEQHNRKTAINYAEALQRAKAMHLRLGHIVSRGGYRYRVTKVIANPNVTAYCPYRCKTCGTKGHLAFPKRGNIKKIGFAADPQFYPPGTKVICLAGTAHMEGPIDDKGGAIDGPKRFDLRFQKHEDAVNFGRPKGAVIIILTPLGRVSR